MAKAPVPKTGVPFERRYYGFESCALLQKFFPGITVLIDKQLNQYSPLFLVSSKLFPKLKK